MLKTFQILTTPTNRGAVRKCYLFKSVDGKYISHLTEDKAYTPQKMMLLSNEKINEGDYVYELSSEHVHKVSWDYDYIKNDKDYKKILASNSYYGCVPNFQESFIKEWCKNPTQNVDVECNDNLFNELKIINNEIICHIKKTSI